MFTIRKPFQFFEHAPTPSGDQLRIERRLAMREDGSTYLVDLGSYSIQDLINSAVTLSVEEVIDAYSKGDNSVLNYLVSDVDYTVFPDNPYALHRALSLASKTINKSNMEVNDSEQVPIIPSETDNI